ncbi:MAG: biotin/lipoyl-containing protein, partial [Cyclobacteriaceae bacterium]
FRSQACLCITHSKLHTVDYYLKMTETLIDMGAEEICIKDMAGIGRPASMGKLVQGIKSIKKDILVTYHGHSGPGFSVTSSLEAARGGADFIDVGMEPLSFGTGHADLLTVHAMLKDAGFSLPDINMKAYMQARAMTQEFIDDFLGYYINPKNRLMNALLIGPGLPGGMMGSLMSDLENNLKSLNSWKRKNDQKALSQDELLIKLFEEVEVIWPMLGYPPLVTPYSQYVKNAALVNVIQMEKGKERWSLLDDNTWDMVLGKSGRLPGAVADELINLATAQARDFFVGDPQDLVKDTLPELREEMIKKGWDIGKDDEELFEFAMHPQQYEAFKSGKAKSDFEADIAKKRTPVIPKLIEEPQKPFQPKTLNLDVNGEKYRVTVSYDSEHTPATAPTNDTKLETPENPTQSSDIREITAPLEGKIFLTKDAGERAIKVGDRINKGDTLLYIEAMKVTNAIKSEFGGTVVEVLVNESDDVYDDDILIKLS